MKIRRGKLHVVVCYTSLFETGGRIMLTKDLVDYCLGVKKTITKEEAQAQMGNAPEDLVNAIVQIAQPATQESGEIETWTRAQFIDSLKAMRTSAFATIGFFQVKKDRDLVKPKTLGTSGRIACLGVSQLVVNANYANMVNNVMGKLTEIGSTIEEQYGSVFEAAPRQWGERVVIDGKPIGLVYHKGLYYLESAKIRDCGPLYWFFDGQPVDYNLIAGYLHDKKEESKRQPVPEEYRVKWRTWGMDTVQTVSITPNMEPRTTYRFKLTD